jgi:hypothetical protein
VRSRPLVAKDARRAKRSGIPDACVGEERARDVFVGPAAKRACSRPEFDENVLILKPLCSVSINKMHYMSQQKSFLPPNTITRAISETSPPGDVSQSGSSGKPEKVVIYVPVQRAADEPSALNIAANASPVAGAQPPPQHSLKPPLSSHLSTWSTLPTASMWVLNTIKRGYTLQFARRPPRFGGVILTEVSEQSAPLLREEISSLLAKQAVEIVPEERKNSGFYSRYFLVPKKDGGMRPILDLRLLNKALAKRAFKMLTVKQILAHIQPDDYFLAVDLKDAYFHIQIAPHHRRFLRFAFEGVAYQFKVLPFGLALAPRVFTMCMNAALAPLKLSGMRILNYLDDWLVIARSRSVLVEHRHRLLAHLMDLGLSVNMQKSALQPCQSITFLGMVLDSRTMIAKLSEARIQSIQRVLALFVQGRAIPLKTFQRLLGLMAAAAPVCRLGLLHMRPLQHWLQGRVQPRAWRAGTERLVITRSCLETLAPWFGTTMFEQGSALGRVVRRVVVTTDASLSGWGALCDGRPAFGTWTGDRTRWHINCLEMEAVHLALRGFPPICERPSCSHQNGQHGGGGVHKSPRRFTVAIPAGASEAAIIMDGQGSTVDSSSACAGQSELRRGHAVQGRHCARRVETSSADSKHDLESVWQSGDRSLRIAGERPLPAVLCIDDGHSKGRRTVEPLAGGAEVCFSSDQVNAAGAAKDQGGEMCVDSGSAEVAQPAVVPGASEHGAFSPVADSAEKRPPISGEGDHMAPQPGAVGPARVADQHGVSQRVLQTIAEARAPSTRRLYALKWRVFANWCVDKEEDPRNCDIAIILTFLQERLDAGSSPSTLKVYVAAIAACRNVDGHSVGKHPLITGFLRGARRLFPPRLRQMPVWDLSLVLSALSDPPFEPAESSDIKVLSFKTALLLALACGKRVGDLQALSVNSACMQFGPGDCMVRLLPKRGYSPKVLSTPFRAQVITIPAFCPDGVSISESQKDALCPVRALRAYVNRTSHFRTSEQLFVCFAGAKKGGALSKQRLSHWIVEAVRLAYTSRGAVCPIGVHAHSTRSLASSWAWARGMSIQDICFAAGWSSRNTFARFYNLNIPSFTPHVLSVHGEKAELSLD